MSDPVVKHSGPSPLRYTCDEKGVECRFEYQGDNATVRASATVTCPDPAMNQSILLKRTEGNLFRAGPVRLCGGHRPKGFGFHMKSNARKERAIEYKESDVTHRSLPNFSPSTDPRKNFVERPKKKPLVANLDLPHYYSRRTRAQGEADLRKQCSRSKKEDSYLFVGGIGKEGKQISYWYEIGTEETEHSARSLTSSLFSAAIMRDFRRITGMSHYHFHPVGGENAIGQEYPSPTDLAVGIAHGLERTDEIFGYPKNRYDIRVVTPAGVFTITPHFERIRAYPEHARKQVDHFQTYWQAFTEVVERSFPNLPQAEKSAAFARGMSSPFATVTFEPFGQ